MMKNFSLILTKFKNNWEIFVVVTIFIISFLIAVILNYAVGINNFFVGYSLNLFFVPFIFFNFYLNKKFKSFSFKNSRILLIAYALFPSIILFFNVAIICLVYVFSSNPISFNKYGILYGLVFNYSFILFNNLSRIFIQKRIRII